jgi:GTP-binding protein Era
MLKKVGTEARYDMEDFFGKKVYLELYVKVTKDWRDKPESLKRFGYRK